jgi:hypothetical protein
MRSYGEGKQGLGQIPVQNVRVQGTCGFKCQQEYSGVHSPGGVG